MDKIQSISILVLQNWLEKHMIGMRQLPIVTEVCVNAVLENLAQSENCWSICRDHSNVL